MGLLWSILVWTIFGLVCGAIARLLVPGRQPIGVGMTTLLGIVGSYVGGFLAFILFGGQPWQPSGFLLSILGAVAVLLLYVSATRRRIGGAR